MDYQEQELERRRATTIQMAREDRRLKLPEPLPVRLESVQDVRLPAPASTFKRLEAFYRLLGFDMVESAAAGAPAFRAENHDVRFDAVAEGFRRDDCRPLGIFTPHLGRILGDLIDQRIEFEVVPGMVAGTDAVLVQDPAGNWLALALEREIR